MSIRYLPTHEWARLDGDQVVIGLSAFAAAEVGEIIFVKMPFIGAAVMRGQACAEIESVKSVNSFYCPVDGVVVDINHALTPHPELVNVDALGQGWFAKIKPLSAQVLEGLLSDSEYQKHITV